MAPIKFEENMREKLEKRTIQPSSSAWSTLADRLEVEDKAKSKKSFWWLGIAASIVLLICSGLFFFNRENEVVDSNIVETTTNQVEIDKNEIVKLPETNNTIVAEEENDFKEDSYQENNTIKEQVKRAVKTATSKANKEQLALNESKVKPELERVVIVPEAQSDLLEKKFKEVMAEIITSAKNKTEAGISDREIDSLLNLAQKEILKDKIFKKNSRAVDANALLQDVEFELEESFRTKVFETLKNSFETVKSAVAERNN